MSRFERFRAATLAAMLAFAAVNACSFFFRSNVERLWGVRGEGSVEAIGFPLLVWSEQDPGVEYFSYPAFATDLSIGVGVSLLVGAAFAYGSSSWSPGDVEDRDELGGQQFQFGIRAMLVATLLVALGLGAVRAQGAAARWLVLLCYISGPWLIMAAAFLSRRASRALRVASALAVAATLLFAVIWAGGALEWPRAFERMLMGLFVCWVPQCVLAAALAMVVRRGAAVARSPPR